MNTSTARYFGFVIKGLIVTVPLVSLAINAGITIDLSRAFAIAVLVAFLTHRLVARVDHGSVECLILFWVLSTILTIAIFPFTPNHELANQGLLRNSTTRWVVQWIMLTARVASFLIAFQLARIGLAGEISRTYLTIGLLLSGVGAAQLLLWMAGIAEPFIISLQTPFVLDTTRQAYFNVGSFKLFRLSSLGGEPKHLAASLAPLVAMMGCWASYRHARETGFWQVSQWALVVVIFVFTFSTGAFFGLLAGAPIIIFLCGKQLAFRPVSIFAVVLIAAGCTLAITTAGLESGSADTASAIFEARVTARVGEVDYFERAAMAFVEDRPLTALIGVGIGNIPFYTYQYLEEEIATKQDLAYLAGNTLPMSSHGLTTLIESGLLGFGLLLASQLSTLGAARRALSQRTNTVQETRMLLGLTAASVVCITLQPFSFCGVQYVILGATAGLAQRLLGRRRTHSLRTRGATRQRIARPAALVLA